MLAILGKVIGIIATVFLGSTAIILSVKVGDVYKENLELKKRIEELED